MAKLFRVAREVKIPLFFQMAVPAGASRYLLDPSNLLIEYFRLENSELGTFYDTFFT